MDQSVVIHRMQFVPNAIKHVTVIGAGTMGTGIAQVTALAGQRVTVVDISEDALKKSKRIIENSLLRGAKKLHKGNDENNNSFVAQTMSLIKFTTNLENAVKETDLVIECVVENLKLKQDLFEKLDKITPENTILASNTSSLLISECMAPVQRKNRVGGLHFFNPVPMMPLLEVIRIPETSDETYGTMIEWGTAIGKTCITCKDRPGFVVNSLLVPYLAQAVKLVENGVASVKDIDTAMKLGAGYPMGPFELLDRIGLDTGKSIIEGLHRRDPRNIAFETSQIMDAMIRAGKLGKKSGEGFYRYSKL